MALFPLFVNLKEENVLVIGGGVVALRKIEKLLPFEPNLRVIAKNFKPETLDIIKKYKIPYEEREFKFSDLKNQKIVIVAVDNINLQKEIFEYTRGKNILVNSVDSPDYCDFIFPAYIKKEDIVIGITTSGKAPGLSAKLRKLIENCLPENITEVLNKVENLRKTLPKGEERQKKILKLIDRMINRSK